MVAYLKIFWSLLKDTFNAWQEDNASNLAAALAYYTIFAIAPLLLVVVSVAGVVAGQANVQTWILEQVEESVGAEAADSIDQLLLTAFDAETGRITTVIALGFLLFSATNVLAQLQTALNRIWNVKPRPKNGLIGFVRTRLLSLSMAVSIGFLLMVSLVVSTLVASLNLLIVDIAPAVEAFARLINFVISFAIMTVLFGMIFRVLPHVNISWRDVAFGSAFTAFLFLMGQWAISQYIARTGTASAYGAAGSLIVILLWVYYSAQILFFGAEFTQVWAKRYGADILPSKDAVRVIREYREWEEVREDSQCDKQAQQKKQTPRGVVSLEPAPETIISEYPATLPRSHEPAEPNNPIAVSWFSGFVSGLGAMVGGAILGGLFLLRGRR